MAEESLLPMRMVVVEQEGSFVVTNEDDPSDWVACFTPEERFPARDWAERMAELYNLRGPEEGSAAPEKPPLFLRTHHPLTGAE